MAHNTQQVVDFIVSSRFEDMPDKAIDVVDEAGARQRLKPIAEREPVV